MKKLNKLLRGRERGCTSSLRSRLFIKSGLDAFPNGSDIRVDSTSWDVVITESSLWAGKGFVCGRVD